MGWITDFIGKHASDLTDSVSARIKKVVSKLENSRIVKAFPRLKKNANDVMSKYELAVKDNEKEPAKTDNDD